MTKSQNCGASVISSHNGTLFFPALNGWRFWAALTILIHHCVYLPYFKQNIESGIPVVAYVAMPFFFMLSGFLAAASAENGMKWDFFSTVNYYIRRFIRIWPQHFFALLVFLLLLWKFANFHLGTFIANLLLIQSWIPRQEYFYSYNAPVWYLSSLMGLYLLTPLLVRYKKASICFSIIFPVLLSFAVPGNELTFFFYILPLSNCFQFLFGMVAFRSVMVLTAHIKPFKHDVLCWSVLEIALIGGIMSIVFQKLPLSSLNAAMSKQFNAGLCRWINHNLFVPVIIIFLMVFSIGRGIFSRLLANKAALVLGKISFVLYIWHWVVRDVIVRYDLFHDIPIQWRIPTFIAIAVMLAFPLEYLVNSPVARLLNTLHKKHPFHLEFFRRYAVLALALCVTALYLGCVLPRPVDFSSHILSTMTAVCDNVIPVQSKIFPDNVVMVHPGMKPTRVFFRLNQRVDRFSCTFGLTHEKANVIVKFYLDDRLVKEVHAAGKFKKYEVSFPCSNAQQLSIEVDKNGDISFDTTIFRALKFTGQ